MAMKDLLRPLQRAARSLRIGNLETARLLLPGALLMAMSAQLLAAFMLVDLGFATFL